MFSTLGWTREYFDWPGSGLTERPHMKDYAQGRRVTAVVTCPQHAVPEATRRHAVDEVLAQPDDRDAQFVGITIVAEKYGISPQALRTWVHQEERNRWRSRQFAV
jgi:hypothetical protein